MPHPAPRVHFGARTAMDGLEDTDRQRLLEAIERLQETDPVDWPADQVSRLPDRQPLYLLRVPPDYRVVVARTESNGLEIREIFQTEEALSGSSEARV